MSISENVRGALRLFAAIQAPPRPNRHRADRGALEVARRDPHEAPHVVLVEILADLHHYADRLGLDWTDLVARAQDHRNHEQPDEPAALPLAIIGPGGSFAREVRQ